MRVTGRSRILRSLRCRTPMRRKPTRRKCSASGNSFRCMRRLGEAAEQERQAKQAYESAKQYYERAVREGASRLLAEKKTGSFCSREKYVSAAKRGSGHPPGPRRRLRNMSTCTSCFKGTGGNSGTESAGGKSLVRSAAPLTHPASGVPCRECGQ